MKIKSSGIYQIHSRTKLKEKLAKDLKDIFQKYDKNICRYC